jgi:hypothetical protein
MGKRTADLEIRQRIGHGHGTGHMHDRRRLPE